MVGSSSTEASRGQVGVRPARIVNALSVDVEDYYQVQALSDAFPRSDWDRCESRIESSIDRLLELLSQNRVSATFFTLGWIAERHGAMVRRIVTAGHEIACHGYSHERVDMQSPKAFRADIRKAKLILEDCAGVRVRGYRAATFSISRQTPWAFSILEQEGFRYSSSVYPVVHDNYAFPDAPRFAYQPEGTEEFWEIPITTFRLFGRNIPFGGGGYFRFYPYQVFRAALRHVNSAERQPAVFYFHPWEIDPGQPRPKGLPFKARFRHYLNLHQTEIRLRKLLSDFAWDRMDRASSQLTSSDAWSAK